eukprot:549772-Pyramimonas_sp.AAC.1
MAESQKDSPCGGMQKDFHCGTIMKYSFCGEAVENDSFCGRLQRDSMPGRIQENKTNLLWLVTKRFLFVAGCNNNHIVAEYTRALLVA